MQPSWFLKHKGQGVKVDMLASSEVSLGLAAAAERSRQQLAAQIIPVYRNCYWNNLVKDLTKNQRFLKKIH